MALCDSETGSGNVSNPVGLSLRAPKEKKRGRIGYVLICKGIEVVRVKVARKGNDGK